MGYKHVGSYIHLQIMIEYHKSNISASSSFIQIVYKIELYEPALGVSHKQKQQGDYKAHMFTRTRFQGC